MKKYLIILTLMLVSCNYKNQEQQLLESLNETLNLNFETLENSKDDLFDEIDYSVERCFGSEKALKFQQKARLIQKLYNYNIQHIDKEIKKLNIKSTDKLDYKIIIDSIENNYNQILNSLFGDSSSIKVNQPYLYKYLMEFHDEVNQKHSSFKYESFCEKINSFNSKNSIILLKELKTKVLNEQIYLIKYCANQIGCTSRDINVIGVVLGFEKSFITANENNTFFIFCNEGNHIKDLKFFSNNQLLKQQGEDKAFLEFTSPSIVGEYNIEVIMEYFDMADNKKDSSIYNFTYEVIEKCND